MKIKLFITSLLMCVFFPILGRSDTFDKIRDNLTRYKTVTGDFDQTRSLKDLNIELKSQGQFTFKFPLNLTWNQKVPFALEMMMTPDKIVQKGVDGKEQTLTKSNQPVVFAFSSSFMSVFSGDKKLIEKHFNYKVSEEGKVWKLILDPKDSLIKKAIQSVVIHGDEFVRSVEVTEKSRNVTLINFENIKGLR